MKKVLKISKCKGCGITQVNRNNACNNCTEFDFFTYTSWLRNVQEKRLYEPLVTLLNNHTNEKDL